MDRDVLLIYLRNLLELEFAKNRLTRIYNQEQESYNAQAEELQNTNYWKERNERYNGGGCFISLLIMTIVLFLLIMWVIIVAWTERGSSIGETIGALCSGAGIIFVIGLAIAVILTFLMSPIPFMMDRKAELRKIEEHNAKEEERVRQNATQLQQKQQQWNQRSQYLKREYSKVNNLLAEAYRFNILPNQYRHLASVYYIYDYMSSSHASLEDTLIHEHMENGIQRILKKLDTIIAQNEEIILQNRQREIADQGRTRQILDFLNRMEGYGRDAAYNSRLAANYAEANAYFSLATYLKN